MAGALFLKADALDNGADGSYQDPFQVADDNKIQQVSTLGDNKEKEGLTIHFQWKSSTGEFPHLYYDNVNGNEETNMTSPGVPMHKDGDGWYSYTITGADSAEV